MGSGRALEGEEVRPCPGGLAFGVAKGEAEGGESLLQC